MTSSFWLEDAPPRPRGVLDGSVRVGVAVVGGGFTGLWTAREILRRDPGADVLVCEAEHVGFGASGRNGAWLAPYIALSPGELIRRTSPQVAKATLEAMRATIDHVIRACESDRIDAQIRRGGMLRVARGAHEVPAMTAAAEGMSAAGLDDVEVLDAAALEGRVRIAGAVGAVFDPHAAAVHPGRLVRGLADAVEAAGARIVESTPALDVRPGTARRRPRIVTPSGDIEADHVVVATEAWTARLPRFRRRALPLYSLIVMTEPVDDATWSAIGWEGHELLASHRYTVDYLSRTVDGRILFGGRGAPYHFGSRISPAFDHHEPTHTLLRNQLRGWFPMLSGVGFSHAWGGPLAMPRDWMPNIRLDDRTRVAAAFGYTGQGVATSNLAGRVLADLIVDGDTPYNGLPFVGHRSRRWEPEPLRWLGTRYVQRGLASIDLRAENTKEPPDGTSLAERLVRH